MITQSELELGSNVGKYFIEREIGRGGMGVVYLARDSNLNRNVALKVLHPLLSGDAAFIERFCAEARVIAGLAHPRIIHINTFDSIENRFVIDMEYVNGPSLQQDLRSRLYTPARLAGLAHEVLQGLAACHAEGIVHRDLKPSNVLIAAGQHVKLCDFGLATAYIENYQFRDNSATTTGFYVGTPRYAPPEFWEGCKPTCAWDLYSLGIMLYEGATGDAPYDGENPLAILKARIKAGIPPVKDRAPNLSNDFADFIHALLAENSDARPHSAQEAIPILEFERPSTMLADNLGYTRRSL